MLIHAHDPVPHRVFPRLYAAESFSLLLECGDIAAPAPNHDRSWTCQVYDARGLESADTAVDDEINLMPEPFSYVLRIRQRRLFAGQG